MAYMRAVREAKIENVLFHDSTHSRSPSSSRHRLSLRIIAVCSCYVRCVGCGRDIMSFREVAHDSLDLQTGLPLMCVPCEKVSRVAFVSAPPFLTRSSHLPLNVQSEYPGITADGLLALLQLKWSISRLCSIRAAADVEKARAKATEKRMKVPVKDDDRARVALWLQTIMVLPKSVQAPAVAPRYPTERAFFWDDRLALSWRWSAQSLTFHQKVLLKLGQWVGVVRGVDMERELNVRSKEGMNVSISVCFWSMIVVLLARLFVLSVARAKDQPYADFIVARAAKTGLQAQVCCCRSSC